MSKWTLIGTNALGYGDPETRGQKVRRRKKFEDKIRNTTILSEEQLKEESERAYVAELARKEELVDAYKSKKLKSQKLIKEARTAMKKNKNKNAGSASEAPVV